MRRWVECEDWTGIRNLRVYVLEQREFSWFLVKRRDGARSPSYNAGGSQLRCKRVQLLLLSGLLLGGYMFCNHIALTLRSKKDIVVDFWLQGITTQDERGGGELDTMCALTATKATPCNFQNPPRA